jgi:hypothetical protein
MCMSALPSTSDSAACSAQLSMYMAKGECVDAGAPSGPDSGTGAPPTCSTATFPCAPGRALEYCVVKDDSGACTSSYYVVSGQTFVCVPCTDMSGCGGAARAACAGGDAGATD